MSDDPNLEPGNSFGIATGGVGTGKPISIATSGFISPIIGDLIFGGSATVLYITNAATITEIVGQGGFAFDGSGILSRGYSQIGSSGITLDGSGILSRGYSQIGSSGITLDGSGILSQSYYHISSGGINVGGIADIVQLVEPTVGGLLVSGGAASLSQTWNIIASGGLISSGAAQSIKVHGTGLGEPFGMLLGGSIQTQFVYSYYGSGDAQLSGSAILDTNAQVGFGRGGARLVRPVPKLPATNFELPKYNPDDYLQPMDYLKKVQTALKQAQEQQRQLREYFSKGTLQLRGQGKIVTVYRDQPDSTIYISNNTPLEPIELHLGSMFANNNTKEEIAKIDDKLLLDDMLSSGNFIIRTGPKSRFIHQKKKSTGGAAGVNFVSGSSTVKHVNRKQRQKQFEDDEILLDTNRRNWQSREEKELEELKLLGVFD